MIDRYCATLQAAIESLGADNYPRYRERLALQRAVFGLASLYVQQTEGAKLSSLSPSALARLRTQPHSETALSAIQALFVVADLIAVVASADPYSVSDDFIASLGRHSPHKIELIDALRLVHNRARADPPSSFTPRP